MTMRSTMRPTLIRFLTTRLPPIDAIRHTQSRLREYPLGGGTSTPR